MHMAMLAGTWPERFETGGCAYGSSSLVPFGIVGDVGPHGRHSFNNKLTFQLGERSDLSPVTGHTTRDRQTHREA